MYKKKNAYIYIYRYFCKRKIFYRNFSDTLNFLAV